MPAHRIAIYGKGGIGKSTIATNLSILFAKSGKKVLHVGCDPKRDSSLKLLDGQACTTVLDAFTAQGDRVKAEDMVAVGRHGVHLVEAGGPEPGMGCAGRGVSLMIERLEQLRLVEQGHYEVVVYDVLGDVVCGGFAAPLRRGIGQYVYIVTSEETMSLYAANNIAKAVVRYSRNGIMLAGLIANQREIGDFSDMLNAFAESLGTRLCALFHRDPLVRKAENRFQTVVEAAPDSKISLQFQELAAQMALREPQPYPIPTPLDQNQFVQFIRQYSRDEDLQDEPSDGNDNASASS